MKYVKNKFLARIVLPTILATASLLQGCNQTTKDEIKIASLKESYKKFGVSNETLREYQGIEAILKQDKEKLGNNTYLELYPTYDSEGNIVEGEEGKFAKAWYRALREKHANAINRRYRIDNGLENYDEDEENLPRIVEFNDISIECLDEETGIYIVKAKVNEEVIEYSNKEGSKHLISEEVAEDIKKYYKVLSTNLNFNDIIRDELYKDTNKNKNSMESILDYEYDVTESGELQKGKNVAYYHFGVETQLENKEKNINER